MRYGSAEHVLERHRGYASDAGSEHWLNQLLYVDLKTFLPCLNLAYTDKMSMAASTEVRVRSSMTALSSCPGASHPSSNYGD